MAQIDIRLKSGEMDSLRSLIGKKLESMQHVPFNFVNIRSYICLLSVFTDNSNPKMQTFFGLDNTR